MSTENSINKGPSGPKSVSLVIPALVISLGFNIWFVFWKIPVPEPKPMFVKSYQVARDSSCSDTINMDEAKAWIAAVNKAKIQFNNKSIFICSTAVHDMEIQPGFNGIYVRRGMDADNVIHDLGWASLTEGYTASNAFLLEWVECACAPCCGSDTSDFHEYTDTTISH